jgi:hypothetical protein
MHSNHNVLDTADNLTDTLNIRIPDPMSCLPHRARKTGGKYRQSPLWSPTLLENGFASREDFEIISMQPSVKNAGITHNRAKFTFSYLSLKNYRTQFGESPHELANAMNNEVNPMIVDYQLQGVEFALRDGLHIHRYTADNINADVTGKIGIEEVKASQSYFVRGDNALVYRSLERKLTGPNIEFRRITADDMDNMRRRQYNVKTIFNDRFTRYEQRHIDAVQGLFATGCEQPRARVQERLHQDSRISSLILNAMMVGRHLAYNLDQEVGPDTVVSQPPAADHVRDIRDLTIQF